jgi:hypothetical protein
MRKERVRHTVVDFAARGNRQRLELNMKIGHALLIAVAVWAPSAAAQDGERVFLGESSVPSSLKRTDEFQCGDNVLKIDRTSTRRSKGLSISVIYNNVSTDTAPILEALDSTDLWDADFKVLDCPREEAARFYVEAAYGGGTKTLRFSVHAESGLSLDQFKERVVAE